MAGTSAVEFALLAPVFLSFFLGLSAYGVYFGASHSVQQLAADTARSAVAGISAAERVSIVARYLDANTDDYPFLDRQRLNYTLSEAPDGTTIHLVLDFDATGLPIWALAPELPLPGKTIRRGTTIRVGGL